MYKLVAARNLVRLGVGMHRIAAQQFASCGLLALGACTHLRAHAMAAPY